MTISFARFVAAPIVSAGVIGGAALGIAGIASAQTTHVENSTGNSIVATPDTYATPPSPKCPGGAYTTGGRN